MAYSLPTFNLRASIWFCTRTPGDGAADITNVPCQKYISSRPQTDTTPPYTADSWVEWAPAIMLRFPRNVEYFVDTIGNWPGSIFEVPAGSAQYYRANWQEIMHEGFPNEYAVVLCAQCDSEGKAVGPPGRTIATGYGFFPC